MAAGKAFDRVRYSCFAVGGENQGDNRRTGALSRGALGFLNRRRDHAALFKECIGRLLGGGHVGENAGRFITGPRGAKVRKPSPHRGISFWGLTGSSKG